MNRIGLLAAVAVMLTASPSFAQFGGMGGGGGGAHTGMGGQGAPGTITRGRRLAAAGVTEIRRAAKVEMEGGQLLTGKIELRPVVVDGDLGQFVFMPDKIKMIRFLKPADDGKPGNEPGEAGGGQEGAVDPGAPQNRAAALRARRVAGGMMGGGGGGMMRGGGGTGIVADPRSQTGTAALTRGKMVTTADKEIVGMIHIPGDFSLELEFGTLTLAPEKLRSITFTEDIRNDKTARAEAVPPSSNVESEWPAADDASPPRYCRQDSSIIVISPVGDRVTLYNFDTKKSETLALSGSKDSPLEVTPVLDENLVALSLKGPRVTRIAVADTASGIWYSQVLLKPIDGQAVPIIAPGVVVYHLGREVYAYGVKARRWDVAQLPEGVQAAPVVEPGTVTIENHGHIYTFSGKTGKWEHIDVRALLGVAAAEKK